MKSIEISGRAIGPGSPPYVVAELSCNHNGDRQRALEILEAAAEAGADAVKLQTYTADTMTIACDQGEFVIRGGLWDGYTLHALYEEAHTPWSWHSELFERGRQLGVTVFSAPFDPTAVDFLEGLGCPAYKIASFEVTDLPLIERAASTGKPLIVSTGMASRAEVEEAVAAARGAGARGCALLHCVSAYPAPPAEMNLRTIPALAESLDVVTGLSDHTLDPSVAIAAVALGASIIEKHVTLRRSDGGHDAAFSLEPRELRELVERCRVAWEALGSARTGRLGSEEANATFRRSLYVVKDVAQGEPFTPENVRSIRPGLGLAPKHLNRVLGSRATRDVKRGTALAWELTTAEELD